MKITTITVHAERKFNHPTERFANFGHGVTLTAELEEGDVPLFCCASLRLTAERIAEQHKRDILHDCELAETWRAITSRLCAARDWRADVARMEKWAAEHDRDLADVESEERFNSLPVGRKRELLDSWGDSSADRYNWLVRQLTKRRDQNLADLERVKAEGPQKLAALESELAALPAPRLLPAVLAAEKEIHPGHSDHPATGERDFFDD